MKFQRVFISPMIYKSAVRLLVLFLMLPWLWNCSLPSTVEKTSRTIKRTSKEIVRDVTLSGGNFKRQVAIAAFETITEDPESTVKLFYDQNLPDYLGKNCKGVIVGQGGKSAASQLLSEPPRLATGQIDAYALSIIGRQLGINAVIIGSLENIRKVEELRGILWNRETIHLVRVVVRMEVYQPLTATKVLDSIYRRDVPIDEMEYEQSSAPGRWKLPLLDDALAEMLEEMGEDICDAILDQPWNGFVTAVNGDKVTISAGSAAGLRVGMKLNVFDSTQIIEGADGQRFFMPGPNTARIEVVAVTDDRSEARQIDGEPIKSGDNVRSGD